MGSFDGDSNDSTGYLKGTAYDATGQALIDHAQQAGIDLNFDQLRKDDSNFEAKYNEFMRGVLDDNGLTLDEAKDLSSTDSLKVSGERIEDYLDSADIDLPEPETAAVADDSHTSGSIHENSSHNTLVSDSFSGSGLGNHANQLAYAQQMSYTGAPGHSNLQSFSAEQIAEIDRLEALRKIEENNEDETNSANS